MAQYTVQFKSSAARQLRKLDRPVRVRISTVVDSLASNPRPAGAEKFQGEESILRLRVGDYRILYQIVDDRLIVLVVRVGHRREVYRQPF